MKPKKPARIKGRVAYTNNPDFHLLFASKPELPHWTTPHLILPIDNPDALVEQIGRVMAWEAVKHLAMSPDLAWEALSEKYTRLAREALRSIGVPLKKSATKTAAPPSQQGRLRLR